MISYEIYFVGQLSDNTWVDIETELLKFKKLSDMPMSNENNVVDEKPKLGHSQSDLFIYKQSVSDKMVADCVESLIGTYVKVSVNNSNIIFIILYFNLKL